ncbi:LuxR C-terminal-related transcriptional regulator [Nesterenkonia sp. YGD6]|uniref:helix-turn-helix transcriptional regulator n=1 Tax=Nesterenkonia sp. YGD6 TaxID=2901231 RepID=UPI001F4CC41F|nr:LuxR C-terminal-related transcriptional regulator [Nesterenkonia sp. YGD6]
MTLNGFGISRRELVGRSADMQILQQHAERARHGHAQLVVIEGEAGVGKTTLVKEFLASLEGFSQFSITLLEEDQQKPASVFRLVSADPSDPTIRTPQELVEAARSGVAALHGPFIAVVEDFHWADPVSVEAATLGLRQIIPAPGLLLFTMQHPEREDLKRLVQIAQSNPAASHIVLSTLSEQGVREYLSAATGLPISEHSAAQVHHITGGLPVVVHEAATWLEHTKSFPGRSTQHVLARVETAMQEDASRYRQHIVASMESLSTSAREVLELLALAAVPLPGWYLLRGLHAQEQDLAELRNLDLVSRDSAGVNYRLRSASWQSTLRDLIPPVDRVRLLLALAEFDDGPESFAFRLSAARLGEDQEHLVMLGELGVERTAELEEQGFGEKAESLIEQVTTALPQEGGLRALISLAVRRRALPQVINDGLDVAFENMPEGTLQSAWNALMLLRRGSTGEAVASLGLFPPGPASRTEDVVVFAYAVSECGRLAIPYGIGVPSPAFFGTALTEIQQWRDASRAGAESREDAPEVGDYLGQLMVIIEMWSVLAKGRGERAPDESVAELRDLLARRVPGAGTGLAASAVRSALGARMRLAGECRASFRMLESLVQEPATDYLDSARLNFGLSLFYSGRWDEAEQLTTRVAANGLDNGEDVHALIGYAFAALVPLARGQARGERLLDVVKKAQHGPEPTAADAICVFVEAWACLLREENPRALDLLLALKERQSPWSVIGLMQVTLLGRLLCQQDRSAEARDLLQTVSDVSIPATPASRRYAENYLSGLTADDPRQGMGRLLAAIDLLDLIMQPQRSPGEAERGSFRLHRALLALDIADLCAAHPEVLSEHRTRALGLLAWAGVVFTRCGVEPLAEHVGQTRQRLRAGIRGGAAGAGAVADFDDGLHVLTRREREVARHVARGLTNREVADHLVLSVRTVETHVRNILKKLELDSRKTLRRRLTTTAPARQQ